MRALLFFYYLCRLNFNNVKLESMIHFLEQNFVELVTITSMIYLILAVILFLFKTPDTKVYKPFRRSKSLMAGGMAAHQPEYLDLDCFFYRKLDGI